MIELFQKGGLIMWPLLLASLVSLTVVIERLVFLVRESKNRDSALVNKFFEFAKEGNQVAAIEVVKGSKDALIRILSYSLSCEKINFETAVLRASSIELSRYAKGLSTLDTIITLAPLLGLLGTVTGMIGAFGLLGGAELDAPSAITGGIAEALIATAFGLAIAIISLIPFNFLNTKIERFRSEIEQRVCELELIIANFNQAYGDLDHNYKVHGDNPASSDSLRNQQQGKKSYAKVVGNIGQAMPAEQVKTSEEVV